MILRIVAPYFVAASVWTWDGFSWRCTRAAPIVKWMVGKTTQEVWPWLTSKRFECEWL